MNIIKAIAIIGALIPVIKAAVEAVETPGHGAEKKQAVLDVIRAIIKALPGEQPEELIIGIAGAIIDILVALGNLTGKLSPAPDPTPQP